MAGRGNPKWVKGFSGNPGGKPKIAEEFREKCRRVVDDHVLAAWTHEVETMGDNWIKASELLAAYGYGRPAQPVTGADGEGGVEVVVKIEYVGVEK